jgi:enoyl-CoA hydratase
VADLSREGALATIELGGRPLGARESGELGRILAELLEDRTLRAVELRSAGPDFCPGAAADLPAGGAGNPAELLAALPVPVVAVLAGAVRSAGLELALAADIRVAAGDATFALGDVERGRLPSWGGTQRLPRLAGRATATAMIMLGEELDAGAAHRCGLVQYLGADAPATARELLAQLLELSPLALGYAKEAINHGSELGIEHGLRLEGDLNSLLAQSEDRAEGLRAFFEKRPPSFQGR